MTNRAESVIGQDVFVHTVFGLVIGLATCFLLLEADENWSLEIINHGHGSF